MALLQDGDGANTLRLELMRMDVETRQASHRYTTVDKFLKALDVIVAVDILAIREFADNVGSKSHFFKRSSEIDVRGDSPLQATIPSLKCFTFV